MATIDGEPQGKGSVKISNRGGFARKYFGKTTKLWMEKAISQLAITKPAEPFDGPLRLDLDMLFRRPAKPGKGTDPEWVTKKPDYDNVCKSIGDALVSARIISDDSRIVHGTQSKRWQSLGRDGSLTLRLYVWRKA